MQSQLIQESISIYNESFVVIEVTFGSRRTPNDIKLNHLYLSYINYISFLSFVLLETKFCYVELFLSRQ